MAISGRSGLENFKHIIINNGAHDSVGGQPTVAMDIGLPQIATACGYRMAASCNSITAMEQSLRELLNTAGPAALEIQVNKGNRKDLGRPTSTPQQNKQAFMQFVQS
jgi:phosphonopyruvate decarboxylase